MYLGSLGGKDELIIGKAGELMQSSSSADTNSQTIDIHQKQSTKAIPLSL